ncbi:hypothetical protein ACFO5R_03230 [Halosolutus amylolyticus]|uniref:Uncharacterized protein n=1 Tax=Halosolutus amylolyticus TaxID=2932267 RepID=A0ABD5PKF5_9EURY|nr:hypothetical protein [Halosolutus amylolyticus]
MARSPEYGETWVYESLVGAIPGLDLSDRAAIVVQFCAFELAILAVAASYGLWEAVVPGTIAVLVATGGSWLMLRFSRAVRGLPTPEGYRRVLFGSSVEVVLGVVAFVLLVTYLFVTDPRTTGQSLLVAWLGPEPPAPAVALALLVCWDVVYRIGTCWWASVAGLWRSVTYEFDLETSDRYARADGINVAFAAGQLLLVPFVLGHPLLLGVLVGHVVAVATVATLSGRLQRRSGIRGEERDSNGYH